MAYGSPDFSNHNLLRLFPLLRHRPLEHQVTLGIFSKPRSPYKLQPMHLILHQGAACCTAGASVQDHLRLVQPIEEFSIQRFLIDVVMAFGTRAAMENASGFFYLEGDFRT